MADDSPDSSAYHLGETDSAERRGSSPSVTSAPIQGSAEFTEYYFSKSAFKEKLVAPLEKLYAVDDKFIEYTAKYSTLLRNFSLELDKLKDRYEKQTSKLSEVYSVNECYSSFSDILKCQSALMMSHSNEVYNECFGEKMKKELHNQRGELMKLNEDVDRADKHHMDSIAAIKAKRKACHSLVQDSEKVEEKRPDPGVLSEKLVKYKNNRDAKAKQLDDSNEEYLNCCAESNKSRLNFELTLQDALQKYQHMASERVYLVQSNCKNFIKLHDDFCEKFSNTSSRFKTSVSKVDVQQEVNKFVQITTAKSKQELDPEMIIFDLPNIKDEDSKRDETKMYTIRQLRKEICIRKIVSLKKREEQIFKNLDFARTILNKAMQDSHGMQGKFTDQEKSQKEFRALLHELDIVQVSIQNLVNDYYALNRSNSPRDQPHFLTQFLSPIKEANGKGVQYMAIRPPLDYYWNNERDQSEIGLPSGIQQEIEDAFGGLQAGASSLGVGGSGSARSSLRQKNQTQGRPDMSDQTYRTPITTSAATAVVAHQQQQQNNNQYANDQDNKSHDLSDEGHWEEEEEGEGATEGWKAIVRFTFDPAELYPDMEDASYMLKVTEGQTITVLEALADDWCLAEDSDKNTGHVPSAYIEAIE